jgi:hypothetical protein
MIRNFTGVIDIGYASFSGVSDTGKGMQRQCLTYTEYAPSGQLTARQRF